MNKNKENYNEMMNNMKNLTEIEKKYTKESDNRNTSNQANQSLNSQHNQNKTNITSNVQDENDEDTLPEGVLKIERSEKIIEEKGVKKKLVKLTKYMEDGNIIKEIFKEPCKN